jgi:diguanylate cyclase
LLELLRRVTGLETTFVTHIDWEHQVQDVVVALNTEELVVETGSRLPWAESMCRWTFLSGRAASTDVAADFQGSVGAEVLGMQTFVAVPILADDEVVGTVCGASRRLVPLPDQTVEIIALVAAALTHQFRVEAELMRQRNRAERAEELALTDELTGLANRRAFTARLEEELARAGRQHLPIAVLILDVDDFKAINDTAGHAAGDEVLAALGRVLDARSRAEDIAARIGGDEFALVLAETGAAEALTVANRIEEAFAEATSALARPATISIGLASNERSALRDLLADADAALYDKKSLGTRDRLTVPTTARSS